MSPLTLTNFRYNGGTVCSNVTSGTLTVISGTITGRVLFENRPYPVLSVSPTPTPLPVAGTMITATGGTNFFDLTDADGSYSLGMFGPGTYTVTASRPDEDQMAPNGIFSDDASLIAQYVVGLITLDAVQQRAADVSGLHSISSFEAALIAQWIVGIENPINRTGQWTFTPASTTPDTTADSTQDYQALLLGDVNGDWVAAGSRPMSFIDQDERKAIRVSLPAAKAPIGSVLAIPLRIEGLQVRGVSSYQFDIQYDPAVIALIEPAVDMSGTVDEGFGFAANAPVPGLVKVAVYGTVPVSNEGTYVYLRFRPVGKAGTSTSVTITAFRMNDGRERIVIGNGRVTVTPPNSRHVQNATDGP